MNPFLMPALAEGATTLTWETVSSQFSNAWTMVESAIGFITSNSVFVVIFAASLIPIGFRIFKKAKRTVSR